MTSTMEFTLLGTETGSGQEGKLQFGSSAPQALETCVALQNSPKKTCRMSEEIGGFWHLKLPFFSMDLIWHIWHIWSDMIWYDLMVIFMQWVWVFSHLSFEHGGPGICVLRRTLCDARCPLVRCLQGQTLEMKIMNGTSAKFQIYMMKSNIIKIWHGKMMISTTSGKLSKHDSIPVDLYISVHFFKEKHETLHLEILQISAHLAANEAGAAGRYSHAIRSILRCWPLCISHAYFQ